MLRKPGNYGNANSIAKPEERLIVTCAVKSVLASAHKPRILQRRHPSNPDLTFTSLNQSLLRRAAAGRPKAAGNVVGANLPHRHTVAGPPVCRSV